VKRLLSHIRYAMELLEWEGSADRRDVLELHAELIHFQLHDEVGFEEIEPVCAALLEEAREYWGDDDSLVVLYKGLLGRCLFDLDRFEEAEPLLVEACSARTGGLRATILLTAACDRLEELYSLTGRSDEADAINETSVTRP
jgi:hypothetical protein